VTPSRRAASGSVSEVAAANAVSDARESQNTAKNEKRLRMGVPCLLERWASVAERGNERPAETEQIQPEHGKGKI
jgi:hypothetical protein